MVDLDCSFRFASLAAIARTMYHNTTISRDSNQLWYYGRVHFAICTRVYTRVYAIVSCSDFDYCTTKLREKQGWRAQASNILTENRRIIFVCQIVFYCYVDDERL